MEFKTLIGEETLQRRVKELAKEISNDYEDKDIDLICILKGSYIFTADLSRYIDKNVNIDFLRVSSYENNTRKEINVMKTIIPKVEGKNVILVEDIVDSGYTMNFLVPEIKKRNPKSVKVCTLLDKQEKREVPFEADYIGFIISDAYVLGYGMDDNGNYRNLPFVAYKDSEKTKEGVMVKVPKKDN